MGGLGARVCVQGEMEGKVMLVTSMLLLMLTQPVFGDSDYEYEFETIQADLDYLACIADPSTCGYLCAPSSHQELESGISVRPPLLWSR